MTTDDALEAFLVHPVGGEEPAKYVYGTQVVSPNWIRWNDSFHIFKTAFDLQQAKIDEQEKTIAWVMAANAEQQNKIDELVKDAERYRHMRGNSKFRDLNGPVLYWYLPRLLCGSKAEQLDAAIDSAIQQSTHTGG